MNAKIYIAGPMSGIPGHNYDAFFQAERDLIYKGWSEYEIINPARINPITETGEQELSWEECMRRDIPELLKCNSIYLLQNWYNSKGARLEKRIADDLGFAIFYEKGEAYTGGYPSNVSYRLGEPGEWVLREVV